MDRIRLNIQTITNNLQQHINPNFNFNFNNFIINNNHHAQYTAGRNNIKSINTGFLSFDFDRLGIHDGSNQLIGSSIGDYTKLLVPLMQNLPKISQPFLNVDLIEQFSNRDNCWMSKSKCCYVSHEFLMNVLFLSYGVEKNQKQKICYIIKGEDPMYTYYWEITPS
ncbi:hypothetical protein WICANDRAFT_66025 [Wickerhamomyces anomalus NRRL Y-366-8]|uniref:Uncharacterized protein n=1 Tax=Wickerhamomyces anomalus (strain ATCC 58044 / CBS 1984 / NCYC 433 / NRRL Y-366-8) TaxID=683960 RepID=A0A1E3P8C6_WICAA|nr:uncharacterized protein WICANDRAFT_66025 [Wickerhamomyces anomalus NRRL Y-366-8]ODQ61665.1 hypothetical protein WICANDRAFT_66025 [Wickerhamomyces anomalus NRRL Y-366-8]